jgi:hypothetical protein
MWLDDSSMPIAGVHKKYRRKYRLDRRQKKALKVRGNLQGRGGREGPRGEVRVRGGSGR